MWHLRKAAMSNDFVEQFNELWLGLESTNHLLVSKHNLPTRFTARSCEKCGAPMDVVGSSAGITFAVVDLAGGTKEAAKRARNLRKSLHHGFGSIYDDRKSLPDLVPLLRDALALALADLMDVPRESWPSLRRTTYALASSRGEVTVRVTLHDIPVPKLMVATQWPELQLGVEPYATKSAAEPDANSHFGKLILKVINHDGRWTGGELTWRGRGDPEVTAPSDNG
jgi:hypothetical protein